MDKLQFRWQSYSDHVGSMLHEMRKSNDLTDVTLVCDDKTQLSAHRVVLSSCSPVFRSIFSNSFQNVNSVIYFGLTIPIDLSDNLVFTRIPASRGCMFVLELNCETDSNICFDISRHIVRSSASKPDLNMVTVIRMKNNQCFTFCTYPDMILLFQSIQTIILY